MWAELVARSIRAPAGRPGMMVHVAYGYGLFTGGLGAHYGAEAAGLHGDPHVGRHDGAAGAAHQDFQPDIIMVTPSYMLANPGRFTRQGIDPSEARCAIGIFGAEPWTNAMRRKSSARSASMPAIFTGCRR